MDLLLDTHIFLWWNEGNPRLPLAQRTAILSPANNIFVSAVTVWEIAIKRACGKLTFNGALGAAVLGHSFIPLSISIEHAEQAGALPTLHRDPFDRLLVSQALLDGLTLVTVDQLILQYRVPHL